MNVMDVTDPRPDPRTRVRFAERRRTFAFRLTDSTRVQLEAAARQSGRSLSAEIEHRLEQSFSADSIAQHGSRLLLRELGAIINRAIELEQQP